MPVSADDVGTDGPGRRPIAVVFGTRPEAIKMAPVVAALQHSPLFEPTVIVTAQHREMLDQVLARFDIRAEVDLDLQAPRQSLTLVTERVLTGLAPVLARLQPDAVVVQGDTTTTMATALAAFYARLPVAHVEAGLRTYQRWTPYPEEINRRLTTQLATLHLPPTPSARANLLAEGVPADSVVVTGNTVIDALLWAVRQRARYDDPALGALEDDPRKVLLVTMHRRESWGAAMAAVGEAIALLARTEPDLRVVLPLHKNPVVREALLPALRGVDSVLLTEPQEYAAFARLMARADILLTDSGGIQEEGPSLGKPVLVLRDTTERPEAIAAGTARLVGTDPQHVVREVRRLLHEPGAYDAMAHAVNPYGDGLAAGRVVDALACHLGLRSEPVDEFSPGACAQPSLT